MNILIAGGTGLIGGHLIDELALEGYHFTVLSRKTPSPDHDDSSPIRLVRWDARNFPDELKGERFDAVINLSGAPIADKAWTAAYRKTILESRTLSTAALVRALAEKEVAAKVFLNASAIGYYGHRGSRELDESCEVGEGFAADISKAWEAAARGAGIRTVLLRIGIVMAREGGALEKMLIPFKLGLGGYFGKGTQGVSWIHIADIVGIIKHLLSDNSIEGAVNLTAPTPRSNKEFSKTLARKLRRIALPIPVFLPALILGKRIKLLTDSQYVYPRVMERAGYRFRFTELEAALEDLL